MSGRRLTPKDMSAAKYEAEVFNARLKRGEVDTTDPIARTQHVVCGCGAEGCIFLSHTRKSHIDMMNANRPNVRLPNKEN